MCNATNLADKLFNFVHSIYFATFSRSPMNNSSAFSMTTIPKLKYVNPQLPPTANNNCLHHLNILTAKKIVGAASSSDPYHAYDYMCKNYETLVNKTTSTPPSNKIAVNNITTRIFALASIDGSGAFPAPLPSFILLPSLLLLEAVPTHEATKSGLPLGRRVKFKPTSLVNCPCLAWSTLGRAAKNRWPLAVSRGLPAVIHPRIDFGAFFNPEHLVTACTSVGRQEVTERTARKQGAWVGRGELKRA